MVAGKFGEHEDFVWCQRLTEQVAFLDSALFHDGPFWVSVCTHVSGLCQLCFALLLIEEFLAYFGIVDGAALSSIEQRIEQLLSSLDIDISHTPRSAPEIRNQVAQAKPGASTFVIDHDASVGTLLMQASEEGFIFATWDVALTKLVERVARVYADTPSRIVDFLSMARGVSYESEQTVSLLDSLIYCDERKAEALAMRLDNIKTAETAFELQRYTDAIRKSSAKGGATSVDLVEEFFAQHRTQI